MFGKSKRQSIKEVDYDDDPETMQDKCDRIIEQQTSIVDDKAARFAIENKQHNLVRAKLNNVLDEVAAKSHAG